MSKFKKLPQNSVLVITGPTASGKTKLAIELALEIDAEIISADSRQVYKLMDICTAKPSNEELALVQHHLIDFLEPDVEYSAGKFVKDAESKIEEIISIDKIPIVCGGSAFYIKALFYGLFKELDYEVEHKIRKALNEKFNDKGIETLKEELRQIDIETYEKIELENPHRVIRALEYYYQTGEKISSAYKLRNDNKEKYNPIYFAIDFPRDVLYDRINKRCEKMWESGIVDEYKKLLNLNFDKELNSLNTVGYKEIRKFLEDKFTEIEAIEEFKKNTRRFAKRQLTWFRKNEEIHWIDYKEKNKQQLIKKILENAN